MNFSIPYNLKKKIIYISKKELSIANYDACVAESSSSMIYAYSWYLDSVADDWGVLVLEDYKAVMPVPFLRLKRNLFSKKIYQPDFCQQLGIFSQTELTQETAKAFFDSFIALNPKVYNFNFLDSQFFSKGKYKLKERINYELNLNNSYADLYANYSTNRKRNLKKAYKENLYVSEEISIATFISFKKQHADYRTTARQYQKMNRLMNEAIKKGKAKIFGVIQAGNLIAVAFVLNDKQRLISIITATNEIGKKIGAIAFLNDTLIKKNANTTTIFDFEGSMISGISRFYKSFGAKQVNYLSFE